MEPKDIVLAVLLAAVLLSVTWTVWVLVTFFHRRRTAQMQAELHSKLLDKLGSSQDLLAYLETAAGQQMLRSVGDQADPAGRILNAIQIGIVLIALGGGLMVSFDSLPKAATSAEALLVLGIVALALGLGFLAASLLSYIFSRAWGLLKRSSSSRQ